MGILNSNLILETLRSLRGRNLTYVFNAYSQKDTEELLTQVFLLTGVNPSSDRQMIKFLTF